MTLSSVGCPAPEPVSDASPAAASETAASATSATGNPEPAEELLQRYTTPRWTIGLDPESHRFRLVERRDEAGRPASYTRYAENGLVRDYRGPRGYFRTIPKLLHPRFAPAEENHSQYAWYAHFAPSRTQIFMQQPRLLFVGDSITWRWRCRPGLCDDPESFGEAAFQEFFARHDAATAGIPGDRIQHVRWRLAKGVLDVAREPELIVLMAGINNRGDEPPLRAEALVSLLALIRALEPGVKVLLLGLLPAARIVDGEPLPEPDPAFRETNEWLAALPALEGIRYHDASARFLDAQGRIDFAPETTLYDAWGWHPRDRGYRVLAEEIAPIVESMLR